MIEYTLNIGDVVTSLRPAKYRCLGLGSCIGLFIQDRAIGLSGGAHILLPENAGEQNESDKFYSASTALDEILNQFKLQGSNLTSLRAKITGGANVIGVNMQTGKRNVESVVNRLVAHKIFIAAIDVGGGFFRSAKFLSTTGELTVSIPQKKECKVY